MRLSPRTVLWISTWFAVALAVCLVVLLVVEGT